MSAEEDAGVVCRCIPNLPRALAELTAGKESEANGDNSEAMIRYKRAYELCPSLDEISSSAVDVLLSSPIGAVSEIIDQRDQDNHDERYRLDDAVAQLDQDWYDPIVLSLLAPAAAAQEHVVVIGISGASRSGKGVLTTELVRWLEGSGAVVEVVTQDMFFDVEWIKANGDHWEAPQSISHAPFKTAVEAAISQTSDVEAEADSEAATQHENATEVDGDADAEEEKENGEGKKGPKSVKRNNKSQLRFVIVEGYQAFHDSDLCDRMDVR